MAKIEIDLSDLGLGHDEDGDPIRGDVRSQVVDQAARMLADQYRKKAVTQALTERLSTAVVKNVAGS